MKNFRAKSANVHSFSMIPRADIPRANFKIEHTHKTTFDAGYLVPIYVDEILPGDTFNVSMTGFCRTSTPIFPIMDNLYLDTFFFFVPSRLVWENFKRFMGEQPNPTSSTDFLIPQAQLPSAGVAANSLGDYFGLPTAGQVLTDVINVNALPLRAYNLIFNEWFRDQNLIDSLPVPMDDGPDNYAATYTLQRRGKRHDYFTSALPFVQKGPSVTLPLGTTAPVLGIDDDIRFNTVSDPSADRTFITSGGTTINTGLSGAAWVPQSPLRWEEPSLFADLSAATAATINQIRQSFQIQKLLERDARGGTRYTEIVRSHFGVISPDARLQRPEYLGGSSNLINISQIPQTSATGIDGGSSPLATLSAYGTGVVKSGFTQSFTEHGYVIGLASVRADLTYQQGLRKLWSRRTRFDFYFPVFSHLGEQAILNKEIWIRAAASDNDVFGYQERWAEYRHHPSRITGLFRSTTSGTIDGWHLSQRFTSLPTLNETFIQDNPPMSRVLAVGAEANGQQFIFDALFTAKAGRPLPVFSVPGLIDHF